MRAHTGVLEHEPDHAADLDHGAVDWLVTVAHGLHHDAAAGTAPDARYRDDTTATSAPRDRHQPVVPGAVLGPERHRHEMVLQRVEDRRRGLFGHWRGRVVGVDIGLDRGREGSPRHLLVVADEDDARPAHDRGNRLRNRKLTRILDDTTSNSCRAGGPRRRRAATSASTEPPPARRRAQPPAAPAGCARRRRTRRRPSGLVLLAHGVEPARAPPAPGYRGAEHVHIEGAELLDEALVRHPVEVAERRVLGPPPVEQRDSRA